jgi:hypothetical protein
MLPLKWKTRESGYTWDNINIADAWPYFSDDNKPYTTAKAPKLPVKIDVELTVVDLSKMVTVDSPIPQEITGPKTFTSINTISNLCVRNIMGSNTHTGYGDGFINYNYFGTSYRQEFPKQSGTIALTSDIPTIESKNIFVRVIPLFGYDSGSSRGHRVQHSDYKRDIHCLGEINQTLLEVRYVNDESSGEYSTHGIIAELGNSDYNGICDQLCDILKTKSSEWGTSGFCVIKDTIFIGENTTGTYIKYLDEASGTRKALYIPAGSFAKIDIYLKYLVAEDRPYSFWAQITVPNTVKK